MNRSYQSGVALIAMLLVFVLVVILVAGVVTRTGLAIQKTGYHLQYSQAYEYALGAEALARQLLHKDWQDDLEQKRGDSLQENWAQPFQFEPDNGLMRVHIEDLHGRFNLNSLVSADGKSSEETVRHFKRLLSELEIASLNADIIVDWLDSDTTPRTSRSEDSYYLSQSFNSETSDNQAYRSADRPMAHLSELAALQLELSRKNLRTLEAEVTSLPVSNNNINPNTATKALLNSLHPELNAEAVIEARDQLPSGFESVDDFLTHAVTAGLEFGNISFSVRSEYFDVWVIASFNEQIAYLRSRLHRNPDTGVLTTLHRSQWRDSDHNPLLKRLSENTAAQATVRTTSSPSR